MVQVSYPGVYIEEVPSGVHTVTSVSTSIAAFIDFFKEGPMDEAVQIFGMADFGRIFGGLDDRSEASYAISQFFLNGGSQAYVVRVAAKSSSPVKASVTMSDSASGGADLLKITAANEGVWGNNLRIDIDLDTEDATKYFNMYVTRYNSAAANASPVSQESFLKLSPDPENQRYVEAVVNDESSLIQVEHKLPTSPTVLPVPGGTLGGDISFLTQADRDALGVGPKQIKVKIGSGATVIATLDTWLADEVATLQQLRAKLEQAIRGADPTSAAFAGATVSLVDGKRLLVRSGSGASTYTPAEVVTISNAGSDTTAQNKLKLNTGSADNNVQQYQLGNTVVASTAHAGGTAGADGAVPTPAEIIGSKASEPYTGMYALDYVDLFNILCIPRAVASGVSEADTTAIISNALAYCEEQRAFMIIDIPENINAIDEMKDWMDDNSSFRHRNAAVYFPRLKIPDPENDYRLRSVGCSGTIAGMYARIDGARGVWKTPAGIETTIRGVSEMDMKLTDAQNGTLNPLGINCLRTFPIYGDIVWGGRTLRGADAIASEWKYLAVRRLALMIEESLFRGTKWVVFEGNDEPLWAQIRMNLGAYMNSLFRQGAFQGSSPKEAYYVKCDRETTTQNDINQGIVNIEVGFAPLKPAEFVVIKIQQISGEL